MCIICQIYFQFKDYYSVFRRFRRTRFAYGDSILSSSQFLLLTQQPLKMTHAKKVVKIGLKVIISLPWFKMAKQTVALIFRRIFMTFLLFKITTWKRLESLPILPSYWLQLKPLTVDSPTIGVNLTNILWAAFLHKSYRSNFFVLEV